MILIIDNFDSFTHLIAQYFGAAGADVRVVKNDEMSADAVRAANPTGIVLSPGPGRPEESGYSYDICRAMQGVRPIFGICLGHQIIAAVNGATVSAAAMVAHGKAHAITHSQSGLFEGVAQNTKVGRYHSLSIEKNTLNNSFEVTAVTTAEPVEIMAIEDARRAIYGVQFHPESIMTEQGMAMISNFIRICHAR